MVQHLEPHRTVMGHQQASASLPGPFCKFQQVSRYVSYRDSSIVIRIVRVPYRYNPSKHTPESLPFRLVYFTFFYFTHVEINNMTLTVHKLKLKKQFSKTN